MSSKRIPFVGGNWKCNGSFEKISELIKLWGECEIKSNADVMIGVPTLYIPLAKMIFKNKWKKFHIAAQNCYPTSGAFTGETSVDMLEDYGIEYCIIGHSERRMTFGETESMLLEKTKACATKGIIVVGCIGETLEQRNDKKTEEVLLGQVKTYVEAMRGKDWSKFVLAYEPVWSIGKGKAASPKDAQAVHAMLRKYLTGEIGEEKASKLRIIYGGSVMIDNCEKLYSQEDVDGFLIGGASLKPDFAKIVNLTV